MKFPTPDFHREAYWSCEDTDRICEISPRGFGKSIRWSFFIPLAFAALERVQKIALLSKTAGLSEKFLGMIKDEIESNKILREDFPNLRRKGRWANDHIQLANGTEIWAKGWGAQIRGEHPQLIIIDDPEDEESTASQTQLDKTYEIFLRTIMGALEEDPDMKHSKCVVVGTNVHPDCLVSKILNNFEDRYHEWSVLFFSALLPNGESLWPERRPIEWLERKRREIGSAAFSAEFLNEPILGEQVLFLPSFFRDRYKQPVDDLLLSVPSKERVVVAAVDIAQSMRESADFSAWAIGMRDRRSNNKYLLDGNIARLPTRQLAREMATKCMDLRVDYCYIEDPLKESTDPEKQSIVPTVFREEFFAAGCRAVVRTVRPDRDKYRRALPVQSSCERHEIFWPENMNPGLRKVWGEVIRFPLGAHDDGADAFVYCMRQLDRIGVRRAGDSFVQMGSGYHLSGVEA
jgi:predicted phage terminase large subunit-like protein